MPQHIPRTQPHDGDFRVLFCFHQRQSKRIPPVDCIDGGPSYAATAIDHHHHGNEKRMADAVRGKGGKGDGKESTSKNPCPNTEMSDAISTQAC